MPQPEALGGAEHMAPFEGIVRELTSEINGQYPRLWMTDSPTPESAEIFVVGYNPATAYLSASVDYERHIDALFNRNGESCRRFYSEVTQQSPTRTNIEWFAAKLLAAGAKNVLETNVVCYGARKKKHLALPQHKGGKKRGIEIFRTLVREIQPKAIILHGSGVRDEFVQAMGCRDVPKPPSTPDRIEFVALDDQTDIFVIPSLALPGFQNWPTRPLSAFCNWADQYLDEVAARVVLRCAT